MSHQSMRSESEVSQVTHNGVHKRPFVWEEVEPAKDIWFNIIYWILYGKRFRAVTRAFTGALPMWADVLSL